MCVKCTCMCVCLCVTVYVRSLFMQKYIIGFCLGTCTSDPYLRVHVAVLDTCRWCVKLC